MTGDQERFQQAMNQGHSAAWDQSWEKAAAFYRQALAEYPDNFKALTSLGLALFETQNFREALKVYQKAARVYPTDPLPIEKIAEILQRLGYVEQATKAFMSVAELYAKSREVDKAIENWSRVVALNPEHLLAHSRLAMVYEHTGKKPQSVTELLSIASLMQHSGDVQKAIQTIHHALQVSPESGEARQALNMLQSGRLLPKPRRAPGSTAPITMEGVRKLEPARTEQNDHPGLDPIQEARRKALTMLADLLFEQGSEAPAPQPRHGLASIVKGAGVAGVAAYDQTKVTLHLSQAIDLQVHDQDSDAITEMEHAISAGLDIPAAHFILGYLLTKTERLESALRHIQRAVRHETFGMAARLLLGKTLAGMERMKDAANEYLEALRLADAESVPPEAAEELSQLYEPVIEAFGQQTDTQAQKRVTDNVQDLLIRPDWRDNMKRARQQLPAQAEGAPPVPLAEMLSQATSSQVVDSLAKINQYARANMLRTAMEEAFYALKFAPTYLPLHICIGDLLIQEDRLPEAVKKYSIVAESYSIRGESGRAISLLKKVSELAPMDLEARNQLIDLMMSRGQVEETIKEFLRLAETYYSLADLASARKTYMRAIRYAQQANLERDKKIEILHRMADIDLQSLDWRGALRVFEQIRSLEPDDEKARSMLLELNLRLGQQPQALSELDNYLSHLLSSGKQATALKYLTTLIEENPSQPAFYRRVGELYRQVGQLDEAIENLDKAGELFLQTNNKPAAIEAIMAILALNPTNADQYQQLLAQLKSN